MILEALVTTVNFQGAVNLAPMGPKVNESLTQFTLRPFSTSKTWRNLRDTRRATIHVTDDCLLLARTAIGELSELPHFSQHGPEGFHVLDDCCRWFAIEVRHWDESSQRTTAECQVIATGTIRPFFGFCRAKHAVLEAAILATRVNLLPRAEIVADLNRLRPLVDKTGGKAEHTAFEILTAYLERQWQLPATLPNP